MKSAPPEVPAGSNLFLAEVRQGGYEDAGPGYVDARLDIRIERRRRVEDADDIDFRGESGAGGAGVPVAEEAQGRGWIVPGDLKSSAGARGCPVCGAGVGGVGRAVWGRAGAADAGRRGGGPGGLL